MQTTYTTWFNNLKYLRFTYKNRLTCRTLGVFISFRNELGSHLMTCNISHMICPSHTRLFFSSMRGDSQPHYYKPKHVFYRSGRSDNLFFWLQERLLSYKEMGRRAKTKGMSTLINENRTYNLFVILSRTIPLYQTHLFESDGLANNHVIILTKYQVMC